MRITTEARQKMKAVIVGIGRFDEDLVFDHYAETDAYPHVRITVPNGVKSFEHDTEDEFALRVEVFHKGTNLEDRLDEHFEVIENTIKENSTLDGLVEYIIETDYDYGIELENSIGMVGINFKVKSEE